MMLHYQDVSKGKHAAPQQFSEHRESYLHDMKYEPFSDGHIGVSDPVRQKKGTIVHFLPSKQLRLLRDIQDQKRLIPTLMQQAIVRPDAAFPGFNLQSFNARRMSDFSVRDGSLRFARSLISPSHSFPAEPSLARR